MGPEDEDVARERARVEQDISLTDELLLKRLTKVRKIYTFQWALDNHLSIQDLPRSEKSSYRQIVFRFEKRRMFRVTRC